MVVVVVEEEVVVVVAVVVVVVMATNPMCKEPTGIYDCHSSLAVQKAFCSRRA
jgi:hypothetical protein